MNVGDICCIKTTGEKVFILDLFTRTFSGIIRDMTTVRRPNVTDGGGITHETLDLFVDELESMDSHAERQVQEMVLKQKASSRFEALMATSPELKAVPAEPKVN